MFSYASLKSGTDVRGIALSDGSAPVALTDEVVERIAAAFLRWVEMRFRFSIPGFRIAVGRDSRLSGQRIAQTVARTFRRCGVDVMEFGLASSPAMFSAILDLNCDAGVEVTASHLPFDRNGLKFYMHFGGLEAGDIDEILALAEAGESPAAAGGGSISRVQYMDMYAARIRSMVEKAPQLRGETPLRGMKIAVDAGNGAGGFYATKVLEPLGADISGSRYLEPDGRFPNHIPNPEDPTAMRSISEAVVASGSDLGIIFDTDVDRAALVDADGREINRNRLVALAAALALEENPGATVVTDSVTSDGLTRYIENVLGGKHRRFKRGYRNVIDEAVRLNRAGVNCLLAIETSGHAAFRENHFLDDGAYLATRILIRIVQLRNEGRTLGDLLDGLEEPAEAVELRLPIPAADFRPAGEATLAALEAYANTAGWRVAPDSCEGVRISFPAGDGAGWFLLRLSVHDPILPLNLESTEAGGTKQLAAHLLRFFEETPDLTVDLTPLRTFLA